MPQGASGPGGDVVEVGDVGDLLTCTVLAVAGVVTVVELPVADSGPPAAPVEHAASTNETTAGTRRAVRRPGVVVSIGRSGKVKPPVSGSTVPGRRVRTAAGRRRL